MKKTFYFLLFTVLFFSCQKDKSSSSQAQKTPSVVNVVKADSLLKNDTGNFDRPKTINATCARLRLVVSREGIGYTIIGRFPQNTSQPNVVLPKQEWNYGIYKLVNQPDGNLILYKGTPSDANLIWKSASNSTNGSTSRQFYLQTDLNMVEYDSSNAVWATNTQSYKCPDATYPQKLPNNMMLILTSDGDLEIVADAINSFGAPVRAVLAQSRTYGGQRSPNIGSLYLTSTLNVIDPNCVFDYR